MGNFEVAAFLLSPVGLTALVTVGAFLLATLYLQIAGLMKMLDDPGRRWWAAPRRPGRGVPAPGGAGAVQMVAYLVLAAPFLLAIWLVYRASGGAVT